MFMFNLRGEESGKVFGLIALAGKVFGLIALAVQFSL
jgi:hypothetical protein